MLDITPANINFDLSAVNLILLIGAAIAMGYFRYVDTRKPKTENGKAAIMERNKKDIETIFSELDDRDTDCRVRHDKLTAETACIATQIRNLDSKLTEFKDDVNNHFDKLERKLP